MTRDRFTWKWFFFSPWRLISEAVMLSENGSSTTVVRSLGQLAGGWQMHWCCCCAFARVQWPSLVVDINYTVSHAWGWHTRNILVPGKSHLPKFSSRVDRWYGTHRQNNKGKKTKKRYMTTKFLMREQKQTNSSPSLSRYESQGGWPDEIWVYAAHAQKHRCNMIHSKYQQNIVGSVTSVMCVWSRRWSAVCLADRLRAEHRSRTFFSCNNAITRPRAADTGEQATAKAF